MAHSVPRQSPAIAQHSPAGAAGPWIVLLAVSPGIFLALADATAMSIAVPMMIRRLESSVIAVSWVMNGYNLVLTVLFLTCGRLADRFGHKRLFTGGLALFTAASVGCALSGTVHMLIVFRVAQAVGAAAVIPTSLAILLASFPGSRQGLGAGLFGAVSTMAAALGPVVGGVLVQRWGWPAIFWFTLPMGALGVTLALAYVPRDRRIPGEAGEPAARDIAGRPRNASDAGASAGRLDWTGVVLVTAGLFCLTLGLIQGNEWGWTSGLVLGLLAAAALLLALWVHWELRAVEPLFDLRLFRRRTFAAASAAIMTVDVAMMGTAFMLVIFMVGMMDYSEGKAGLVIAALPAAALVLSPFAGRLTDRAGPRWPAVAGALISAVGLFALGHLTRTAPASDVLWRVALVGAGLGLSLPALTAAGMSAVPGGARGAGSGMLNTARQLGFLLGVAILVAVFAHTMHAAVNRSADRAQAVTRTQAGVSADVRDEIIEAIDATRVIDATAGISEIRKIADPVAQVIAPKVGPLEAFALAGLTSRLETIFWDEASAAFRWPLYTAALAAVLGARARARPPPGRPAGPARPAPPPA
jgi:DHA2 family methylenomycin A resistance protein-like MFS transporter